MSIQEQISDVENGHQAVTSRQRWNSMSTEQRERLRAMLLSDSYAFTYIICGHTDLVPELHMPLSYMVCGLTGKLAYVLSQSGFNSYVTRKLRAELFTREIDFTTGEGIAQLDTLLEHVNIRWFRGSYKSSCATHGGGCFIATSDPNETIKITHAVDPKAWEFCSQIGATILSGTYRDIFPDRVPEEPNLNVTQTRINLGGRTISHPQATIQAYGYKTKDTGAHYSTFIFDDLVVGGKGGNATPAELPGVRSHLRGLTGYYMRTRRIRRIHVGTKWAEDDDDAFLTSGERAKLFLTIRVPIEEHGADVVDIFQPGAPTVPQLASDKQIHAIKVSTIDDVDGDGAFEYRCNYLLDVAAAGGRMFSSELVNDGTRWWAMQLHPSREQREQGKFLVMRYRRDKANKLIPLKAWTGAENHPDRFERLRFDPWRDLDVTFTLDTSWSDGGDNWALSCTGDDFERVRFQLETRSGHDGVEGWIEALLEMTTSTAGRPAWRPRVIGFDNGGIQDAAIKKIIQLEPRLQKIKHLFVGIPHSNTSKRSRIRNFVAEPFKSYRLLIAPDAKATRAEMIAYKGDPKATDGILDSLAMAPATHRTVLSPEQRRERDAKTRAAEARRDRFIEPMTGIPYAAA